MVKLDVRVRLLHGKDYHGVKITIIVDVRISVQ